MKTLGNLVWLIFGGFILCIEYIIVSLLLMVTIIGIPFGIQTLKLAGLALWPFGKNIVENKSGTSSLDVFMNILWLVLGGFCIALTHFFFGLLLMITIIGIPFGIQHFKLAGLSLTPFGKTIS